MKYVIEHFLSVTNLIWAFYYEIFANQSPGSSAKKKGAVMLSKMTAQICNYICGIVEEFKNLLEIRLWHFSRYATGVSR